MHHLPIYRTFCLHIHYFVQIMCKICNFVFVLVCLRARKCNCMYFHTCHGVCSCARLHRPPSACMHTGPLTHEAMLELTNTASEQHHHLHELGHVPAPSTHAGQSGFREQARHSGMSNIATRMAVRWGRAARAGARARHLAYARTRRCCIDRAGVRCIARDHAIMSISITHSRSTAIHLGVDGVLIR